LGNHHDSLFQACFGQIDHARSWLRHLLTPALSAAIVWEELQPWPTTGTGPDLRRSVSDLLFTAPVRGLREPAFLAPEHKSGPAPDLPDQQLRYFVQVRTAWRKEHGRYPLVVPIVLHHGRRSFRAGSLLRLPRGLDPELAAALRGLQPKLPFVLDDLTKCGEQQIIERQLHPALRLAMLCLQFLPGGTDEAALAAIARWGTLFREVRIGVPGASDDPVPGQLEVESIASYFLHVTDLSSDRVHAAIGRVANAQDWSIIMSTADKLRAEGRALGKIEGKVEGQAAICLRQLTARFGPLPESTVARVQKGSDADFDRWALRLLDARSLAEVFAHD
jgi:hypothetical protein